MPRRKSKQVAADRVTAADVIAFIERTCFIPEGKFVGQQLKLFDWQKDLLRLIYDNPHGTRRAIVSMGRKGGKTSLSACLLLAHLCGPPARNKPNSQLYSAAQSRDQAAIIFSLAAKMVRLNPVLARAVTIQETAKSLICPELGTRYRALSADATTAYGLSPQLVIHDELGLVRGPRSPLFEALETATGAQENPLSIIISTQAATDADLLSVLIDDALAGNDPHTVVKLYTAPKELDPFDEATIRLANPAFGTFLNAKEVLAMANDAKRMPARQAEYANLILNQRIEASSPFVTPALWQACSGAPFDLTGRNVVGGLDLSETRVLDFEPANRGVLTLCDAGAVWQACSGAPFDLTGRNVVGGLDLSETRDLTALVLIGNDIRDGTWHVQPTFWLPSEGLYDRARVDRIPYDLWREQGYLQTTPGPSVSYEYVAQHLRQVFDQHNVAKIGFDRWNLQHLKPWLLKVGFSEQMIADKFVGFGQGFKDMSPALRDLECILLERKLRHGGHPVLSMCAMNAVIDRDPAGNRKLSKKRAAGRIDGMIALLMAIGVAPMKTAKFDVEALIG